MDLASTVNKPCYGFSQYMCNSVEVVKKIWRSGKCLIGLTHCPHLPDLLSDRQERDSDSSVAGKILFSEETIQVTVVIN